LSVITRSITMPWAANQAIARCHQAAVVAAVSSFRTSL
jgi:hypothetical protein